jgi:hypothetical protein
MVEVHDRCVTPGCHQLLHSLHEAMRGVCNACWADGLAPKVRQELLDVADKVFEAVTLEERMKAMGAMCERMEEEGLR